MVYAILSTGAALSVATLLFAASLRIRFEVSDALALGVPIAVLAGCTVIMNLLDRRHLVDRIRVASLYGLVVAVCTYSFALGGLQEMAMYKRILINCGLGVLVALFPWNRRSLSLLLTFMVGYGCLMAVNTIAIYETLGTRTGYDDAIRDGYLNVAFATASGAICALYRLIERLGPLNIAAFVLCWIGTALALGRGALLFGAFVSAVYLLCALGTRVSTMGPVKKAVVFALFVAATPVVFYQAMSVERTASRLETLFTNTESGSGVAARFSRYDLALDTFYEAPIFGNGMGAYLGDELNTLGYPHNIVLQYMVDAGLIGGVVIVFFLATNWLIVWMSLKNTDPASRNLVLACAALNLLMCLSYMKSHDAYRGLEFFLLSAFPMAAYGALRFETRRVRRRRAGRRSGRPELFGAQRISFR